MQITYIKRHYTRAPSGEVSSVLAVPLVNLDVGEVGGQFLPDFYEFLLILEDTKGLKKGPMQFTCRGKFQIVKQI